MEKLIFNKDEPDTLILADNIITNFNSPPISPGALLVSHGTIKQVCTVTDDFFPLASQTGLKILKYPALTLLPALVDCHVHLAFDGKDFKGSVAQWTQQDQLELRLAQELSAYEQRGILVVRDGGDRGLVGWQARQRSSLPIVRSPGAALFRAGRYGSFLGQGISNVEEGVKHIHQFHQKGFDFIKILVSGIVSFQEYGQVGAPQFKSNEITRLVNTAHDLGLPVMAHASSDEAVAIALTGGVDSIEHGYFISTKSLEVMAAKGIPWIPTVIPVASQLSFQGSKVYSAQEKEVIHKTVQSQLVRIKTASQLGVTLGIGTDAGAYGVPHGSSFQRELELFKEAGLTNSEILQGATSNGAKILGLQHCYGELKAGRPANFIGVKGNPWQDLASLSNLKLYSIVHSSN